jgi:hypothetical protein
MVLFLLFAMMNAVQASYHPDTLYLVSKKRFEKQHKQGYIDRTIVDPITHATLSEIIKDSALIRSFSYNKNTNGFFFKYYDATEFLKWYWEASANNFANVSPKKKLIDVVTLAPIISFAQYTVDKTNKKSVTLKKISEYTDIQQNDQDSCPDISTRTILMIGAAFGLYAVQQILSGS